MIRLIRLLQIFLAGFAIIVTTSCIQKNKALSQSEKYSSYEIWASDQSNSVAGIKANGIKGSYLWIWDSNDMLNQLTAGVDAKPLGCAGDNRGPCNLLEVFPQNLDEYVNGKRTGRKLSDLEGFGRLHGMLADPQNKYVNANIFAPMGGYIGIIDTETKTAVALFRVTATNVGGADNKKRSVHMSYWNADGSAILIANLHGKLLERIDIKRDHNGSITNAAFNKSASLALGKNIAVTAQPSVFLGNNAAGRAMLGTIIGSYQKTAFSDLTPNQLCKENGCKAGKDGSMGGRPNNVIICPIVTSNNHAYITLGGGGLLVADTLATPMAIIGEYGKEAVNGAGCGGIQTNNEIWFNAGVSASPAGATQSTFTVYTLNDKAFSKTKPHAENMPTPYLVFKDTNNTATIGNTHTTSKTNDSGQLPGTSSRRDSHGMAKTMKDNFVHVGDRIQNIVEVFDASTKRRSMYDLSSADGKGNGIGPCGKKSVSDDSGLPINDPAPDLMEPSPDRQYLFVALRGPTPVSVKHSAQGSCPGVGIIKVTENGASGKLVGVLRSTNKLDTSPQKSPGGYAYKGREHSDIHGVTIVKRQ